LLPSTTQHIIYDANGSLFALDLTGTGLSRNQIPYFEFWDSAVFKSAVETSSIDASLRDNCPFQTFIAYGSRSAQYSRVSTAEELEPVDQGRTLVLLPPYIFLDSGDTYSFTITMQPSPGVDLSKLDVLLRESGGGWVSFTVSRQEDLVNNRVVLQVYLLPLEL
jgi:hypothetical protein